MKDNSANKFQFFDYLVFLAILSLPFYLLRFKVGPVPTTLLEILIYLGFIAGLMSRRIKVLKHPLLKPALVFVLFGLISVFFDPNLARAAGLFKAYFLDGFLLFAMIVSLSDAGKRKAFGILGISAAITAVVAIWFFLTGIKSQDGRLLDLDRLSPNYLSMYLVPAAIGLLYLVIKNVRDVSKALYFGFCLVLVAVALYLTASRGILLSLPIGLVVLVYQFIRKEHQKTYKYIAVVASVAVIALGAWFFRPSFGDMGRTGSSSNIRYYIWTTSAEIIRKNPVFGIGLSNFQDYFTELTKGRVNYGEYIAPQALTAHNLYLHLYLTTGVLGLVSFLSLVGLAFTKSKNIVVAAMVISILVYGLVDVPFFRNDLAGMFWILLALL